MNTGLKTPSLAFRCLLSGLYLCHLWSKRIGQVWTTAGDKCPPARGSLGRMHELFGDRMDALIDELNKELTA